ncbi:DUF6510 family protein [Microbacterium sp. 5K110]|jgi:phage FluMu protein Com|uniref:DUF6510 family protein n=1 Tax=unclassified Microbacterium TaxID=2609290 RepID=UPI0010FE4E5E|nr:DUF6510 family protein [Microbacterium sp. 5K110]TLF32559.1 hypothetical protein FE256_05200 [Microbacterium sp. 5K110]
MDVLDGNALAGRLADLLGWDATDSLVRCRACGSLGAVAATAVYATAMGLVARCRACDAVLLTLVDAADGRSWVGMPGISALEVRRA